jgi:5-methylcytosine-specific restriction endonuclease McrA
MVQESTHDLRLVVAVAQQLQDELLPKVSGPIAFTRPLTAVEDQAEGWYVIIAKFIDIDITLFFNKFPGFKRRCFFAGFCCNRRKPIRYLIRQCRKEFQPVREIVDEDVYDDDRPALLKVPLTDSYLRRPIVELLAHGREYYFGLYDLGSVTEDGRLSPEFSVFVSFLLNVVGSLPEFQINELSDDYRACENRQIVAWHLRRERDHELARRCKERDGYRCQICQLKFEEVYGNIGHSFAEAHHRIPLSKLDGEVEHGIADLIIVCANYHRMLHRLAGEEHDIDELKQTYARGTKRQR